LTELMWKSALGNDSASVDSSDTTKSWFLKFLRSPLKIEKLSDKLHLTLSINQFDPNKKDRVIPTGQTELDVCDVVFRSVGYKGRRIFDDLPFDERSGVIPNVNGKVEPGKVFV
jgi:ferredoxin--NADP+ reductase